jgi:hypothetical protein
MPRYQAGNPAKKKWRILVINQSLYIKWRFQKSNLEVMVLATLNPREVIEVMVLDR